MNAKKEHVHILKSDPEPFAVTWSGMRTSEIRINDRDYRDGHILILRETRFSCAQMKLGAPLEYTGRTLALRITHIDRTYGIDSRCVLSFTRNALTPSEIELYLQEHDTVRPEQPTYKSQVVARSKQVNEWLQALNLEVVTSEFRTRPLVDQGDILSERELAHQLATILLRRVKRLT